jgi:hypothetical protein
VKRGSDRNACLRAAASYCTSASYGPGRTIEYRKEPIFFPGGDPAFEPFSFS